MTEIESRTSFVDILNPGGYKPDAPLFQFKNTGNTHMFINGDYYYPGEVFGIDNSPGLLLAMAMGKNLNVKEKTTYQITFGSTIIDPLTPFGAVITPRASLITTEYYLTSK